MHQIKNVNNQSFSSDLTNSEKALRFYKKANKPDSMLARRLSNRLPINSILHKAKKAHLYMMPKILQICLDNTTQTSIMGKPSKIHLT
ncbi:hypothetical protein GDO86_005858 [Hymenochirus boettgeri]|uniref:Uncharacterized protein n=1 Tax=Hymenochirus boettgeri TaxID=247094 RepID=A0A8T2JBP4_9PIPI|nr:hypothetical protein GDO86_005858 [Hymenochirus boettgeri]